MSDTAHLRPYGFGILLLGLVGTSYGEFALQWHFVAASLPYRAALAYTSAALLAVGGVAILTTRTGPLASLSVGCFLGLWALAVHVPRVIADPGNVALWLGLAEIATLVAAGATGWALCRDSEAAAITVRTLQYVFAVCLAIFTLSHFVYADFTANMVPAWIPARLFWAYATGFGHLAAAVSLLLGIRALLGSTLLAAMLASFVVLVHLPRVIADPTNHDEWGLLAASISLAGAAWIMRSAVARRSLSLRLGPPATAP